MAVGNRMTMTNKSQLLYIIEKSQDTKVNVTENAQNSTERDYTACVIDGMALVQEVGKPSSVNTCLDLANHFLDRLATKAETYDDLTAMTLMAGILLGVFPPEPEDGYNFNQPVGPKRQPRGALPQYIISTY